MVEDTIHIDGVIDPPPGDPRVETIANVLLEWTRFTESSELSAQAVAGYYAERVVDALGPAVHADISLQSPVDDEYPFGPYLPKEKQVTCIVTTEDQRWTLRAKLGPDCTLTFAKLGGEHGEPQPSQGHSV